VVDVGLGGEPPQGFVAVVERSGKRVLGRLSVVGGGDDYSELVDDHSAQDVVLCGTAQDVATAVNPK
jgi:hypothetical protein